MELISIAQFQHLTQLSDSDLIAMLESGELSFAPGTTGELLINISELEPDDLARRTNKRHRVTNADEVALLEECIASELIGALEEITEEAMEMALKWHEKGLSVDS